MNEQVLLTNLNNGIKSSRSEHIQGFPDNALAELRGIYALIYPKIKMYYTDPRYKAAAILSLISVAGDLITVTPFGYRCNNGFIDSYGTMYTSDNPVLDNLKITADKYIKDAYFVDKALMYFHSSGDSDMADRLEEYRHLIKLSVSKCKNDEEAMQIHILKKITDLLSKEIIEAAQVISKPSAWDSETWLREFKPIWDSRDRYAQHLFRAQYYKKHVALVEEGCYISQSGKVVSVPWDGCEMMKASKMYSSEISVQAPETGFDTKIEVWHMDCLDAAKKMQDETDGITAVLNLANRQNPGGGVYTGSGAQEESCFLRSNYFTALYPFAEYANKYDLPKSEHQYPLDRNFGGVWSGGVTVFRGRELEGYPLLDEPWKTNFIAVAAINRPRTVQENGELRLHPDMVRGSLNKIRTVMNIAADNKVSNLVLGALGCGAFHNPPKHIAELFLQVLNEPQYKGRFNRVVFAIIGEELCDIFAEVLR